VSVPLHIVIETDGTLRAIYSDALAPVLALCSEKTIARASHVEPNADGKWEANLAPVGGPILGPFDRRQDALDAEVAWLEAHYLNATPDDGRDCPECGRRMSDREATEQRICNDCSQK